MKNPPPPRDDETLLIALEQLGKGLQVLQELFNRIEASVATPDMETAEDKHPQLTPEIPADRTVH